jgi:hypothetical protein
MLRPAFKNIVLFFFVKYLLFYILLMFKNKDYSLIQIGSLKNTQDVFYYFWIFLFLPVVNSILFSAPIFFSFKVKSQFYFIPLIFGILIAEYFVYVYFTSDKHIDINGIYNGIISLLLLCLFFIKYINLISKQSI